MIDAVLCSRQEVLNLIRVLPGCCTPVGGGREEGRQKFKFILKIHIELEGSLGFMRLGLKKKKKMARWLHG